MVFLLRISIGWIAGLRGEKGGAKDEFHEEGEEEEGVGNKGFNTNWTNENMTRIYTNGEEGKIKRSKD
jgi:hypothetical protein